MGMAELIERKLRQHLDPVHLELVDETHMHGVPRGSESHWNLFIVSAAFEGKARVHRHRAVYGALADEMTGAIHALTVRAVTLEEWRAQGMTGLASPACHGGPKSD